MDERSVEDLKRIVQVFSRCVVAQITLEGMRAANRQDPNHNAFTKKDFDAVILNHGIDYSSVNGALEGITR